MGRTYLLAGIALGSLFFAPQGRSSETAKRHTVAPADDPSWIALPEDSSGLGLSAGLSGGPPGVARQRLSPIESLAQTTSSEVAQAPGNQLAQTPLNARLNLSLVDQTGALVLGQATLEVRSLDGGETRTIALREAQRDGSFVVELGTGEIDLVAWNAHQVGGPVTLNLEPGPGQDAQLILRDALAVSGHITDASNGLPIPEARVRFWTFSEEDVAKTDRTGNFIHPRFPVGPDLHQVRVEAPGFGSVVRYFSFEENGHWALYSNLADRPDLRGQDGRPWIEVSLGRSSQLSGVLIDRDGNPICGAEVLAEGYLRSLDGVATRDVAECLSDAEGRFILEGLRADVSHGLRVHAPGFAVAVRETVAGASELTPWQLNPGRVLAGTVLDSVGLPARNVTVELVDLAVPAPRAGSRQDAGLRLECARRRTKSDQNGVFIMEDVALGPVLIHLIVDGQAADEQAITHGDASFLVLRMPAFQDRGQASPLELAFREQR